MTDATSRWMDAYLTAWDSNDADDVRALFTPDALYYTEPFTEPWRGVDAIVAGWLDRRDQAGDHRFEWSPVVVTDDIWIVQGTTTYTDGPTYSNLWLIRPGDGGRAREFTEWWMDQAESS
ncbi:MAG: nuclear transport factor 2 family protein [Mycetocola sp.]